MERIAYDEPTEDPAQPLLPQHVKRALVYMRGNVAEKITLPGLAAACGAPERTLLKQFKRFVGLPPLAYLPPPPSQSGAKRTVASRLRYRYFRDRHKQRLKPHLLERFKATEYRRAFGESPSTTRQRVRGHNPDYPPPAAPVAWREKPALLVMPLPDRDAPGTVRSPGP